MHADNELHEKLRILETEIAVLKHRPALFDPLRDPINRLPAELQSIIQTEAIRCDKTISTEDLRALLMLAPPPLPNNIQVPLELRPQYVKAFLQTNVVGVESLKVSKNQIAKYEVLTGINVWASVRALHLTIYPPLLQQGQVPSFVEVIEEEQAVIKQCMNTQHFALTFIYNPFHCGQGDVDLLRSSGYQEALQALSKLKRMHVGLIKDDCGLGPYTEDINEGANQWGRAMVKKIREAIVQTAPDCQITNSPEIEVNGGNNENV